LKPLGNPSAYNVKYFATSELLEQVSDRSWLAKVTNVLNQYWQEKNARRKVRSLNGTENGQAALRVAMDR